VNPPLLAALAGLCLGALAVAVRWGLERGAGPEGAALCAAVVGAAVATVAAIPSALRDGVDFGRLWPFFAVGLVAPGASQLCLTLAVRQAGPSRAAIFMGTSPLLSTAIALALLGEPFHPLLAAGTALIVAGGAALAGERSRPDRFRRSGIALALLCAVLFATRDNLARLGARDVHPPPLQAAAATLIAAAALIGAYVLARRREVLRELRPALGGLAPAGLALAGGYGMLFAAYDHGRVSIVSPLAATGSLWAVLLAAIAFPRSEMIGRRVVLAGLLVVGGGAIIGAHG
jgi:drug/metabolite transporter (DMT)-like permease